MRLKVSLIGGHEEIILKTYVIFNHSRITLEFQSEGHVASVLPTVTGGRKKKIIMVFSTRRLSMKLFQVARKNVKVDDFW